jgi:hypothetical protein
LRNRDGTNHWRGEEAREFRSICNGRFVQGGRWFGLDRGVIDEGPSPWENGLSWHRHQPRLNPFFSQTSDLVVTELAVIDFRAGRATLAETAPGITVAQIVAMTTATATRRDCTLTQGALIGIGERAPFIVLTTTTGTTKGPCAAPSDLRLMLRAAQNHPQAAGAAAPVIEVTHESSRGQELAMICFSILLTAFRGTGFLVDAMWPKQPATDGPLISLCGNADRLGPARGICVIHYRSAAFVGAADPRTVLYRHMALGQREVPLD